MNLIKLLLFCVLILINIKEYYLIGQIRLGFFSILLGCMLVLVSTSIAMPPTVLHTSYIPANYPDATVSPLSRKVHHPGGTEEVMTVLQSEGWMRDRRRLKCFVPAVIRGM